MCPRVWLPRAIWPPGRDLGQGDRCVAASRLSDDRSPRAPSGTEPGGPVPAVGVTGGAPRLNSIVRNPGVPGGTGPGGDEEPAGGGAGGPVRPVAE